MEDKENLSNLSFTITTSKSYNEFYTIDIQNEIDISPKKTPKKSSFSPQRSQSYQRDKKQYEVINHSQQTVKSNGILGNALFLVSSILGNTSTNANHHFQEINNNEESPVKTIKESNSPLIKQILNGSLSKLDKTVDFGTSPMKQVNALDESPNTELIRLRQQCRQQDGKIMLLSGQADRRKQLLLSSQIQTHELSEHLHQKEVEINELSGCVVDLKNSIRSSQGKNALLQYQLKKSRKEAQSKSETISCPNNVKEVIQASPPVNRQALLMHYKRNELVLEELNKKWLQDFLGHVSFQEIQDTSILSEKVSQTLNKSKSSSESVEIWKSRYQQTEQELQYQLRFNERLRQQLHEYIDSQIEIQAHLARHDILKTTLDQGAISSSPNRFLQTWSCKSLIRNFQANSIQQSSENSLYLTQHQSTSDSSFDITMIQQVEQVQVHQPEFVSSSESEKQQGIVIIKLPMNPITRNNITSNAAPLIDTSPKNTIKLLNRLFSNQEHVDRDDIADIGSRTLSKLMSPSDTTLTPQTIVTQCENRFSFMELEKDRDQVQVNPNQSVISSIDFSVDPDTPTEQEEHEEYDMKVLRSCEAAESVDLETDTLNSGMSIYDLSKSTSPFNKLHYKDYNQRDTHLQSKLQISSIQKHVNYSPETQRLLAMNQSPQSFRNQLLKIRRQNDLIQQDINNFRLNLKV